MSINHVHSAVADYSNIDQLLPKIEQLANDISISFLPDLIIQISDIYSPGGLVFGSELQRFFDIPPMIITARVTSNSDNREFVDLVGIPSLVNKKILIVDDVIFSGNTVMSVVSEVNKMYEGSDIAVAAIATHSQSNIKKILSEQVDKFFYSISIEGREIKFPWGKAAWFGNVPFSFGNSEVGIESMKRPWGFYEEFANNRKCTVRIHHVSPKQQMSLHKHEERDELFIVIDSGCVCTIDDKTFTLFPNDYVLIPRGTWHRITNASREVVRVAEVAFGHYDQVKDIARKQDDYGRIEMDGST